MMSDRNSVDPDLGSVVAGIDVQEYALSGRSGQSDLAAVPDRVHEIAVFDAREPAFRAEGHDYFAGKLSVGLRETARTARAGVAAAHKLGAGIFVSWIHKCSPCGFFLYYYNTKDVKSKEVL